MVYAAEPTNMPIDLDIVRRVGEYELSLPAIEERLVVGAVPGISTQQPVLSENPKVAGLAHRNAGRTSRDIVFWPTRIAGCLSCFIQDDVDLGRLESSEFDLDIKVDEPL